MVFKLGFLPAVILPGFIGAQLAQRMLVAEPFGSQIDKWVTGCKLSKTLGPAGDALCVAEHFFGLICQNEISKQLLLILGGLSLSVVTYLAFQGGKQGRSLLFHPLVLTAYMLVGQAVGHGVVLPIVVPGLLAITKSLEGKKAGLPAPPTLAYTGFTVVSQLATAAVLGRLLTLPPKDPSWSTVNYAFQVFPLFLAPLAFFGTSKASSKGDGGPASTQTVFSVMRYASIPAYWVSLGMIAKAYFQDGVRLDLTGLFLLYDTAGVLTAFLAIVAIDAVAGDAKGSYGPVALFANVLLAGPGSAASAYFYSKEVQASRRAQLQQKNKLR